MAFLWPFDAPLSDGTRRGIILEKSEACGNDRVARDGCRRAELSSAPQ